MRGALVIRNQGLLRTLVTVAILAGALVFGDVALVPAGVTAQTTPPPIVPTPQPEAATAEPEPASPAAPAGDIDPAAPHLQTIAQGVADLEGSVVWRVREVAPSEEANAAETESFSFNLARAGTTLLLNEASGSRLRLEPGEAGFIAANDPTARTASGSDPATVWVFEVVAPNAQAGDALTAGTVLFTSDIIEDYPEGTFDAEFRRAVMLPNETLEIAAATGPSLVMVTAGRLQGSADGAAPVPLDAGVGRLSRENLVLRNTGAETAVVVVGTIGDPVDDSSAESAESSRASNAEQEASEESTADDESGTDEETSQAPAPSEEDESGAAPTAEEEPVAAETVAEEAAAEEAPADQGVAPSASDTDGDGLSDEEEAAYGSDPLNQDYDADGLLDGVEVNEYGTDPLNNDSDGDGLLDGAEALEAGTNPASTDSDGDGLGDTDETYTYGTGAASFDTDGDGVGDGEEVLTFGTDPLDPASGP